MSYRRFELSQGGLPRKLKVWPFDTAAIVHEHTARPCAQGDRILVIEGDLKNLNGRVTRVAEDGKVDVMPQLEGLTQVLTFEPSQLEKFFEVRLLVPSRP